MTRYQPFGSVGKVLYKYNTNNGVTKASLVIGDNGYYSLCSLNSLGNNTYFTSGSLQTAIFYKPMSSGFYSTGGSGGSGGSSIDYTSILNTIHTDLGNINVTIANETTTLNGSLQSILTAIQNNNNQSVVNAVTNTSAQTQNVISQSSAETQNLITNQTAQSSAQYSEFTNTSDYNQSDVEIDTSGFEFQDVNGVDSFLNTFYTLFQNFFDTLQTDINVVVNVPIPFTNKTFQLDTAPLQRFYANYPVLSNIITALWWVILGRYIIGLSVTIFNWCVSGKVLKDTDKIAKELTDRNIIIKDLMM